jgi:prophage tail gpP-like protein
MSYPFLSRVVRGRNIYDPDFFAFFRQFGFVQVFVLSIAGLNDNVHASGAVEGANVQEIRGIINASECYTQIAAVYTDNAILTDGAGTTDINIVQNAQAFDKHWPLRADGQPRFRPLLIISEQGSGQNDVVPRRIAWEMARRNGWSQEVRVTVDSWRDSFGNLWTPNWLIPVELPLIKFAKTTLLITNVSYIRDDRGTRAELVLMPPDAMAPMPEAPYLWSAALQEASNSTTGAKNSPTSSNWRGTNVPALGCPQFTAWIKTVTVKALTTRIFA